MLTEQCPVGEIASGESDVTRITVLPKAERSPADRVLVTINIVAVVLPFVGLAAAMALTWGGAFDWLHLFIMLGMSAFTAVGITVGFHRLFTHKSFRAPAVVRWLLAVGGSMVPNCKSPSPCSDQFFMSL